MESNSPVNQLIDEVSLSGETALFLNYLGIKRLPEKLFELTQLTDLNLSGNELEILPDDISRLTNLRVLDLAGNLLTQLPETIGSLSQLKHLDLAYNRLKHLPKTFKQLTHLEYLDCCSNQLNQLPKNLSLCTRLNTLRLSENELYQVPETISELRQLMVLDLSFNNLEDLPLNIEKLKQLKELQLNGNLLDIPFHALTHMVYQPAKLIEHFITLKNAKLKKEKEDQKISQEKQAYELKVIKRLTEQRKLITEHLWDDEIVGAQFSIPLPNPYLLSDITRKLSILNQKTAIINYLVSHCGEPSHKESLALVASLESIKADPPNDKLNQKTINEIVSNLASIQDGQTCSHLQLIPEDDQHPASLKLRISCESKVKQSIFALYLSLNEIFTKLSHELEENEESALFDATHEHTRLILSAVSGSDENSDKTSTRISKAIMILVSLNFDFFTLNR